MKEKILQFLKTKLAGHAGGIQDSFLDGIAESYSKTITEESKIATDITDIALESIKAAYTFTQSETDRRAKDAVKTFRTKHGLDENGLPIKKDDDAKKDDKKKDSDPEEPAWFKAYREKKDTELAEMKAKFENQEKANTAAALESRVKAHDKVKNIPASFLKGRNLVPESEDKLDQLVADLEADWNTFTQEQAERGVHISKPASSTDIVKEGEALGKKAAEKRNTNASDGIKGKTIV
jgi:hypothetical protein